MTLQQCGQGVTSISRSKVSLAPPDGAAAFINAATIRLCRRCQLSGGFPDKNRLSCSLSGTECEVASKQLLANGARLERLRRFAHSP